MKKSIPTHQTGAIVIKEKRDNGHRRVALDFSKDPGRTKQQFKEECDISNILKKFRQTGALTHVQKHGAVYGEASGHDYAEAMRIVAHGNTVWADAPSHIKEQFSGPEAFLDFVSDPDNNAAVAELFGEAPAAPAEPDQPPADQAPPGAPNAAPPPQEPPEAPTPSVSSEG